MPVTMEEVQGKLGAFEPNYAEAAKLGSDAMPFLEKLARGSSIQLAMRAVYLASLIGGERAVRLLLSIADSPIPELRVQAAQGARNLPRENAASILLKALDDPDCGVRNVALKSIKAIPSVGAMTVFQNKIEALSKSDPEQFIREFSAHLLRR